jgi:N6-adenosine-specific RNA methylase IME4
MPDHAPEQVAFRTVVCDPPWSPSLGSTWATATTDKARPQKHYKTMSLDEIVANAPENVAPQAHLYLWALNQHLDWGYEVARAWGFEPVQTITWAKPGLGAGRFQCNSEQIIVARKGSRHGNPFGRTGGTWFGWPRGRHSAKPEAFYDMVGRVSPGPYLEMYARENREGWTCIGDECPPAWYGGCGVLYCADCLPLYDANNVELAGTLPSPLRGGDDS